MHKNAKLLLIAMGLFASVASVQAQDEKASSSSPPTKGSAPNSLVILFDVGSSKIRPSDNTILDLASRTFNEGKPIVMIISGGSDRTGSPQANLALSQKRAINVLHALLDRGLPVDRFQVLAKGETEPSVPTAHGVRERENRRVVITWR